MIIVVATPTILHATANHLPSGRSHLSHHNGHHIVAIDVAWYLNCRTIRAMFPPTASWSCLFSHVYSTSYWACNLYTSWYP